VGKTQERRSLMWLIVGGSGQLGHALSRLLTERNIEFVAPSSRDLDIRDKEEIEGFVSQLRPSVIVNAAAYTNVDLAETEIQLAFDINEAGPANLATAAKSVSAPFIHISTDYVFSGENTKPWTESDPVAPVSIYGKSKAAGEAQVLNMYPEGSYILRTAWLYSPWGKNFAKTMATMALLDKEAKVVNDQFGQPTSATDLALQILETVTAKIPFGVYHATNGGETSWFGFARAIYELCGKDPNLVAPTDSATFVRAAKRPRYSVLDHGKWITQEGKVGASNEMRNWREALKEIFSDIESQIKREGVI